MRYPRSLLLAWLLAAFLLVVLLEVGHLMRPTLFPSNRQMLEALFQDGELTMIAISAIVTSLTCILSVSLAALWAVPFGLLLGTRRSFREGLRPTVDFWRSIPPSALIPVAILLLGIERKMFLILASFALGLVLTVIVRDALLEVPKAKQVMVAASNWRGRKRLVRLYLPLVLPAVLSAAQILVSLSMALIVVCEILLGSGGLGAWIRLAQLRLDLPSLYLGLIAAGCCGVALNYLTRSTFLAVEARFFRPLRFPDEI